MTPAEKAALDEAKDILRLHFDAFVIITRANDEGKKDRVHTDWHGSLSDVMGLARISVLRMDKVAMDNETTTEIG